MYPVLSLYGELMFVLRTQHTDCLVGENTQTQVPSMRENVQQNNNDTNNEEQEYHPRDNKKISQLESFTNIFYKSETISLFYIMLVNYSNNM